MKTALSLAALATSLAIAAPATAKAGDPIKVSDTVTIDPIVEGMLRYEHVDQNGINLDADALTMRLRAGAEVTVSGFSILAEAEGTLAFIDDYNDTIPGNNGFPGAEPYSVVADPESVEVNRLQASYSVAGLKATVGRQRIIHDNARFVGNVVWRQNEQTFDAMRLEGKVGPVVFDATYAISQRTIFGSESPNKYFDGNLWLLQGGVNVKGVKVKAFSYLLDYDTRLAYSSQTYGVLASGAVPLGPKAKLNFSATYAKQSDYKDNPTDYSADYVQGELGVSVMGFGIRGGYENLGSDNGVAAFQTPLATAHAFNGWADLFLTTPANGLQDFYGGLSKNLGDVGPLKGMNAAVTHHWFESDVGSIDYGREWNAILTFKADRYAVLVKYANYRAKDFGTDTEKLWLQIGFTY